MKQLLQTIKRAGRALLCMVLEWQVRRLRQRHRFVVVTVSGSMGKTTTKAAIAATLGASKRVAWQKGNYNDRLTVPMVFFDETEPSLFNILAWLGMLMRNERRLRGRYPYDVVVVELGTDGPGQMAEFAYLQPDVAVLTAIAPEHMEFFGSLDSVASEELLALKWAKQAVVNVDDVAEKYRQNITLAAYGVTAAAVYRATAEKQIGLDGQTVRVQLPGRQSLEARVPLLGVPAIKAVAAAAATADVLGVRQTDIQKGFERIEPFPGRMQLLPGKHNALLIDDSYNAAPPTVKAALDVLYAAPASQRIAILGSMNELGNYSPEAHREVGAYCDGKKLDLLVTIGRDAETLLAPEAVKRGCTVQTFTSPHAAGDYVAANLKSGAVVLAKGSQNGVFAEEALKPLLKNPADAQKLVRQSPYWIARKARQFGVHTSD